MEFVSYSLSKIVLSDVEAIISLDGSFIAEEKMYKIKKKNKVVKFNLFIVATGLKKKNRFKNVFLK
jgi:hypothetical protein